MKAILAMSENRAIGIAGRLPWPNISSDFKWFKEFTLGRHLIVGRTTYNTLPTLRNRTISVMSSNPLVFPVGVHQLTDLSSALEYIKRFNEDSVVVIGGKTVYELFMPYITEFYVTHVKGHYEGDTYMSPFEHFFGKQEVFREFEGHQVIKYSAPTCYTFNKLMESSRSIAESIARGIYPPGTKKEDWRIYGDLAIYTPYMPLYVTPNVNLPLPNNKLSYTLTVSNSGIAITNT